MKFELGKIFFVKKRDEQLNFSTNDKYNQMFKFIMKKKQLLWKIKFIFFQLKLTVIENQLHFKGVQVVRFSAELKQLSKKIALQIIKSFLARMFQFYLLKSFLLDPYEKYFLSCFPLKYSKIKKRVNAILS